jgi:tetratricopeptide (TPR) repeat protein
MQNSVNSFLKCQPAMPEVFDPTRIGRTINVFRGDLWLIKLFHVLIRQQPPDDSKAYFFKVFSEYYKGNTKNEQLLKHFIDTYDASKAIWWYSKETFIYDVLNKALREHNIEIICAFHFFIQDLYKSIEHLHHLFNENGSPMVTYRGQKMHQMDVDRIKEAHDLDLRLSINSFLSTTLDRGVAEAFIDGFKPEGKLRGVLFEIECNANLTSRPFGEITEGSQFRDEQEVLFTPGNAFTVVSIESDKSNPMCTIKLRLCDDQEILKGTHKKHMFVGDRDTVREVFLNMESNSLLRDCFDLDLLYNHVTKLFPSDEFIEAEYLQAIGSKQLENEDFELSIENYKKCLALKQKILSSEHKDIAQLYWWIGESYFRLNNYNQIIEFCQKAIHSNSLHPLYVRQVHFYLGCSYMRRATDINWNDISLAKSHFQSALSISLEEDLDDNLTTDIYQALADINENCEDDLD